MGCARINRFASPTYQATTSLRLSASPVLVFTRVGFLSDSSSTRKIYYSQTILQQIVINDFGDLFSPRQRPCIISICSRLDELYEIP